MDKTDRMAAVPRSDQDSIDAPPASVPLTAASCASAGARAWEIARELFPICRSITGPGTRQTLITLQREIPDLVIHEVPSGTTCFDWIVPEEWAIYEAYIEDPEGKRIIDFARNNLHVVSYATPIDAALSLDDLQPHLYSLPEQPDAIPYVTSYYSRRWGFCLTQRQRDALKPGKYRVKIDSSLKPGHLSYGEVILPGESAREVFLSTYVCHPSMANNELSGPVVTTEILRWLRSAKRRKYTYRAVFIPETIGSIVYLSRNLAALQARVLAGFNLTCIGDDRAYSYLPSRQATSLADRAALHALAQHAGADGFRRYSFLERGSDERQYCSPGVDLPVASLMRSKYLEYPEYHTSLDDLSVVTASGLAGGIGVVSKAIAGIEANGTYRTTVLGEPQLGRRGLYPQVGLRGSGAAVKDLMTVLAYSDGAHDLISIAEMLGQAVWDIRPAADQLLAHGLLKEADG